jgi:hypothetical protein
MELEVVTYFIVVGCLLGWVVLGIIITAVVDKDGELIAWLESSDIGNPPWHYRLVARLIFIVGWPFIVIAYVRSR